MSTSLEPTAMVPAAELRADRHPAVVYLARLAPGSRRTMEAALRRIATEPGGGP